MNNITTDRERESARTTIEVLQKLALRDRGLISNKDWQDEMVRLNSVARSEEKEKAC